MKIGKFPFLLILSLLLSSCGNRPDGPVPISQNANLYDVEEPAVGNDITNFVRHTDSKEILSMLDNSEPFVLYVGMQGCYGCNLFKPNLINYVYHSKALVHYLNVGNTTDKIEYSKIWSDYRDIFMADLEVPYLMVVEDSKAYAKGSVSKMTATTNEPFLNMMNSLVKVTNVNSHIEYESANDYYINNENSFCFFYDRNDEDAQDIYRSLIWPYASVSNNLLQVIDYTNFESEQLDLLRQTFSLGDNDIGPIGKYYHNGEVVESHFFGFDENLDKTFLDTYL